MAGDQLKGLAVGLVVGALIIWVPYLLLARSPTRWWLWTGRSALPFFALVLLVAPMYIAPLFNKFGPMKDKALESQVLAVAAQAGVEGARVFEVNKSVDTEKVNAYVTGVGKTKRIVLWDTLLARLTPEQTRFVVGHELGHYVLGHVWINIFVSSALTLLGLYAAHRTAGLLLARFGGRFGFTQLADPASLPLLMLLLSLFSFLITPAALALSRYHEQRSRPLRPGADPRQPRCRHRLRRAAAAEPGRPAPGPALQVLPRQPPAHRRARRLHQRVSSVGEQHDDSSVSPSNRGLP